MLLGGALDPPTGALIVLRDIERDALEAHVKADPYVTNALVNSHRIQDWNVVLGSAM